MIFFPRYASDPKYAAKPVGDGRPGPIEGNPIRRALVRRLTGLGIDRGLIPSFIRSLAASQRVHPHMNLPQINRRLQYLGWDDLVLDYHTWQLALACLETESCRISVH